MRPLLLILLGALTLAATDLRSLELRVDLDQPGPGRGSAVVTLAQVQPGPLALALGFARVAHPEVVEAPAGVDVHLGTEPGTLVLSMLQAAPEATVRLRFQLPEPFAQEEAGAKVAPQVRLFRHRFVPLGTRPLESLRLVVTLPPELRVHAVREQLPRPGRKETTPRVRLDRLESRDAAILSASGLAAGTQAGLALELVPARRSLGWLAAGLVLAVAYLVAFRDLVRRPRT